MVGHVRQGADFSHGAVAEFIEALKSAPAGTNATVFDVGANDGSWAASWKGHIDLFRKESKRLELYFFEPQPHFAGKLTQLAEDIGAHFVPAAAWHADTMLRLETTHAGTSVGASVSALDDHDKRPYQRAYTTTINVRAVDLAAFVSKVLPSPSALSLMKLDVEGGEYKLLPWLLAEGALCKLTYLIPEWHLSRQPPPARLAALGLRLSFHAMLQSACTHPPKLVEHDEPDEMNNFFPVPGVNELARRYGAPGSMGRSPFRQSWHFRQLLKGDAMYLAAASTTAADERLDDCERSTRRRPRCSATIRPTDTAEAARAALKQSCGHEEMACSLNTTAKVYDQMLCEPLLAGDTGPKWCAYGTPLQRRKSRTRSPVAEEVHGAGAAPSTQSSRVEEKF